MKHLIKNNDMSERITNAQVSALYSALPISQFATIVNSTALYFIQREHIDESTANYWLCTLLAVVALRLSLFLLYRYPRQEYLKRDNEVWKRFFFFTAMTSAVIWGASGVFLFPEDNIRHQVFLVFVIAGMASGSIATLSSHKETASLFLIFLMTPIIIQFVVIADTMSKIMGIMMLLSMVSLIILAHCMNRQFIENVKLSAEAKLREVESLQYSALLMQTQKLANISGWDADISNNRVKLSPEFNIIFSHLNENKPEIINAIAKAAAKSDTFDFELSLVIPNTAHKHWVRVIGGVKISSSDLLHGVIQDISCAKSVQLELDHSRREAVAYTRRVTKKALEETKVD
jgi:hypothetical protein